MSSIEDKFGFLTSEEKPLAISDKEKYNKRLKEIEELVLPLLENLYETSDNPIIKWPDRKKPLGDLIKKLKKLTKEIT